MRITVRLFAILRDRAGVSEFTLNLPDHASAADAQKAVIEQYPGLQDFMRRVAFAVNRSYASNQTVLHDGDELALLPPVSGG